MTKSVFSELAPGLAPEPALNDVPAAADDFFTNATDALFVADVRPDRDFVFAKCNRTFLGSLGHDALTARGKRPADLLPADAAKIVVAGLRRCARTGGEVRFELASKGNGAPHRRSYLLTPLRDRLGRVHRILGHGRDLVERIERDARLDISYRLLERIASTTHDIFYLYDRVEKQSAYVNRRVLQILGYEIDGAPNQAELQLYRLVHPDDRIWLDKHFDSFDDASDEEVRTVEYRVKHAAGHYAWLRSSDTVFSRDDEGRARQIVGSAVDISDHRHMLEDLKRLSKKLLDTQNEERRRIARELHDSTAQHLVAIGIGLARLEYLAGRPRQTEESQTQLADVFKDLRAVVGEAQREIRALSYLLHPPVLETLGLAEALRRFVVGFARRTGIRARLRIGDAFSCGSHGISTALMRVAQEALINVYRHARASEVEVRLANHGDHLLLEIEDNGKGIRAGRLDADTADLDGVGVGIPGMRARIRQLQGELEIGNGRAGALVRAKVPQRATPIGQ